MRSVTPPFPLSSCQAYLPIPVLFLPPDPSSLLVKLFVDILAVPLYWWFPDILSWILLTAAMASLPAGKCPPDSCWYSILI
eukprot:14370940-Ditylum_brightwellii.AAC.1